MNLPNLLTLVRIPLLFVIVGLMQCAWPGAASLAFFLFLVAGATDWADGYFARKLNLISNFGKYMDALADKIFVLGLMIAFVDNQALPVFWVLLVLCREFLITGMRMVAASKGVVVAAERGGKQKTATQLIALGFLLFVPMLENDLARFLPWDVRSYSTATSLHEAGLVIFIVATFFTLWSGYGYFQKYWRVVFEESV